MMAALAEFHFIRPGWLLLAPLVAGLWWLWRRQADPLRGWREQIAPPLLAAMTTGAQSASRRPGLLLLGVWMFAIVTIAGPTWQLEPSPFADDATPLMILLKADSSMAQAPPAPSRLERARLKIADLAQARQGQPLGLIAYAGSAHLVLPPTRDTAVVAQMAAEIGPDVMPIPGDRLDLALGEAARVLEKGELDGSLVVLADTATIDPARADVLRNELPFPVQFIAINTPRSPEDQALRSAARTLDAAVETFDVGGEDVSTIVRRAARSPVAQRGEQAGRWQEAGYWLIPLLALAAAFTFRREAPAVTSA